MYGVDSKSRAAFKQKSKTKLGLNPSRQLLEAFNKVFEQQSVSNGTSDREKHLYTANGWLPSGRRTSGAMRYDGLRPGAYIEVDDSHQWLAALTPKEEISWPPNIPNSDKEKRTSADRHLLTLEAGDEESSSPNESTYPSEDEAFSESGSLQWRGEDELERQSKLQKRTESYKKDRPWLENIGPTLISKTGEVPQQRTWPAYKVSSYIRSADEEVSDIEAIKGKQILGQFGSSAAADGVVPGTPIAHSRLKPSIGTREGQVTMTSDRQWEHGHIGYSSTSDDSTSEESGMDESFPDGSREGSFSGTFERRRQSLLHPLAFAHPMSGPNQDKGEIQEGIINLENFEELRERLDKLKERLIQVDPLIEQRLISQAIADASIRIPDEDPADVGSFESVYADATSWWANISLDWHDTSKQVLIGLMLVCLLCLVFLVSGIYYEKSKMLYKSKETTGMEQYHPTPTPTDTAESLLDTYTIPTPQSEPISDRSEETLAFDESVDVQEQMQPETNFKGVEEETQSGPSPFNLPGLTSPTRKTQGVLELDQMPSSHLQELPLLFHPFNKFFENPLVVAPDLLPPTDVDFWKPDKRVKIPVETEDKALQIDYSPKITNGHNQMVIEVEQKYPNGFDMEPTPQERPKMVDLKAILNALERESQQQRARKDNYPF